MSYHFSSLPTAADQVRADGWSPARQRHFLETLAATGVITTACDAVHISARAAYALRIRTRPSSSPARASPTICSPALSTAMRK